MDCPAHSLTKQKAPRDSNHQSLESATSLQTLDQAKEACGADILILETICEPAGCILPPIILARRAPTPANVKAGTVTKGKPPPRQGQNRTTRRFIAIDYNLHMMR